MKMKSEVIMNESENLDLDLDLELEELELEDDIDLELESGSEFNPTLDLVNALQRGDFNAADQLFRDTLDAKVQDTLDAEKVAVADQIFNGEDPYAEIDDEEGVEEDDDLDVFSEIEDIEDIPEEEFVEIE